MNADSTNLLHLTRRFAAPPEVVFDAWTNPTLAAQWLFTSPESETNRTELDPRVDGTWMIADKRGGINYVALGVYLEVERPHRLAFTFGMPQFSSEFCRIAMEIAAEGSESLLTFTQDNLPPEHHQTTAEGWKKMFDGLSLLCSQMAPRTE